MSEQAQEMVDVKIPVVIDTDGSWAAFGSSSYSMDLALEELSGEYWTHDYGDRLHVIELQLPKPQIQTVKVKSKYRSRKEEAPAPQPEATEKTFAVEVSFAEPPFEALHFNTSPFRAATAEEAKEKAIKAHTEWGKADVKVLSCRPMEPEPQADSEPVKEVKGEVYFVTVQFTDAMEPGCHKRVTLPKRAPSSEDAKWDVERSLQTLGFLGVKALSAELSEDLNQ